MAELSISAVNKKKSATEVQKKQKPSATNKGKATVPLSSNAPEKQVTLSGSGWHNDFYNIVTNLGVRRYNWTPIDGTDDAVSKSQNHLVDMIRYYEGHPPKYTASMGYKDRNGNITNGYGIVHPENKFTKEVIEKYHLRIPMKNEYDAYKTMLVYMEEVAKKDVIKRLGQGEKDVVKEGTKLYNSLPQSVKEALLDFAFKSGAKTLGKVNGLKKALEDKDWNKVIDLLIWTKDAKGNDLAGLYRRSLSRVILAAKGLPKSAAIDARIEKLYKDGVRKAQEQNESAEEFHKIYNAYKGITPSVTTQSSESKNPDGTKSFRVNQEKMGIFSVAKSMRPSNSGVNDQKGLLIAIMNEIVKLNSLKSDGTDANGYPKTAMLTSGTTLKVPTSIKFEGKTIKLNEPAEMENVTKEAAPKAEEKKPAEKKDTAQKVIVKDSVKQDTIKPDTLKTDSVNSVKEENNDEANKSGGSFWQKAFICITGAGLGLMAGIAKKVRGTRLAAMAGVGLAMGLGIVGLVKLFTKEKNENTTEDNFDPNDPNVTPFQRIYHEKDVKISELHRHTIKLNNGSESDIAVQILEKEYEVQPYSPENIETIWSIARRHGVSRKELGEYNELPVSTDKNGVEDYHSIKAGQKLTIKRVGYKIENGDTLDTIAEKFGISKEALMDINNIDEESELQPGTMLEIPAFVHKVKGNETLSEIAEKAGISTDILKRVNNLSGDKINEKQELVVVYTKRPDSKESGGDASLKSRPHLQNPTYDSKGNIVATRDEWTSDIKNGKLSGKTIILDAGHGYKTTGDIDIGAPGSGIEDEWLLNYDNVMRLKDRLLAQGAKVIYLQGSKPLIVEALKERRNKGDLFISVHANSASPSAKERTQIYYREYKVNGNVKKEKDKSIKFARIAAKRFNENIPVIAGTSEAQALIGQPDNKGNPEGRTGLLRDVLNNQKMPAVLWEVGFMTNSVGKQRLKDRTTMDKYADIMCQSIVEYYNS